MLYIFGQTSLVGLLAHGLVAALILLGLLLCLIAGLTGIFMGAIVGWFAWPYYCFGLIEPAVLQVGMRLFPVLKIHFGVKNHMKS